MNRRTLLTALAGVVVAPWSVLRRLRAPAPEPPYPGPDEVAGEDPEVPYSIPETIEPNATYCGVPVYADPGYTPAVVVFWSGGPLGPWERLWTTYLWTT